MPLDIGYLFLVVINILQSMDIQQWVAILESMQKMSACPSTPPSWSLKKKCYNRVGKTRDLFKRIRDTKGILHTKMHTIKDRSSMALTEAEDIKKRWQEYTEELCKADLNGPDNHNAMITHLEPDISEHDVK